MIGRLAPGVSLEAAIEEANVMGSAIAPAVARQRDSVSPCRDSRSRA